MPLWYGILLDFNRQTPYTLRVLDKHREYYHLAVWILKDLLLDGYWAAWINFKFYREEEKNK